MAHSDDYKAVPSDISFCIECNTTYIHVLLANIPLSIPPISNLAQIHPYPPICEPIHARVCEPRGALDRIHYPKYGKPCSTGFQWASGKGGPGLPMKIGESVYVHSRLQNFMS